MKSMSQLLRVLPLLLLASSAVHADETSDAPSTAPPAAAPPAAAPPAAAPPAAAPPAAATPAAAASERAVTRETWDASGRVVRKVTTRGNQMLQEVFYTYDPAGRPVLVRTVEGDKETLEKTQYGPGGPASEEVVVNGRTVSSTQRTWARGKLASLKKTDAQGQVRLTTYSYDIYGNLVQKQVVDGQGTVVEETVADFPRPIVPLNTSLNLGTSYASDVDVQELTAGFMISRDPQVRKFGADPLELTVKGTYRSATSGQTPINNLLKLEVGAAYRRLLPRLTVFLDSTVSRNPVANLNMDLKLTPLGARFILLEPPPLLVFLNVAPSWNYRTVGVEKTSVDANGEEVVTTTIKEKSSLRAAVALAARGTYGPLTFTNVLEFAPRVYAFDEGPALSWGEILDQESILTESLEAELRFSKNFSVVQEFTYTRDMALKNQATYDAAGTCTSASTLCDGQIFTNMTSLRVSFSFAN